MKRLFFITWILLVASPLFGQEDYFKLRNEIYEWMSSTMKEQKISADKSPKAIEYPEYGYSIVGYFKKGVLQDSTNVVICGSGKSFKLSGVVIGTTYVKGVKEEADGVCTYGIFKVSNFQDGSVVSKVKKAGELRISEEDVQYYKGYYNDCPAILSVRQNCIAVDGKTGGRNFIGLHCPLKKSYITSIGYRNLKELLLTVSGGCRIEYDGGYKFSGKLQPILQGNGYVAFRHLEGEKTNTPDDFAKVSVNKDGAFVNMFILYKPDNKVLSEEFRVPISLISDENLWQVKVYLQNAKEVDRKYRDGSSYIGKFEVDIIDSEDGEMSSIDVKVTEGTYTYGNGDVFMGNVSGLYYGGTPIDGVTKFVDGTSARGNWLLKYDLTQSQLDSLKSRKYPPTEIRKQAEEYHYSNHYIEYEAQWVSVFSPDKEECVKFYPDGYGGWLCKHYSYLLYDKKAKRFAGIYEYEGKEFVEFEFIVDDYGRHIEEIIYEGNKPTYINVLSWYSNGEIQSIRSYHYDTKLIYLSINFFSDGSFKNAYQYEKGNGGEAILRKSKEARPTYGGFITKQYDLDGNYEKAIKWNIGVNDDIIWGSRIDDLSPEVLDMSTIKRIK